MREMELEIKNLIIECLDLEDIQPDDIVSNELLFGDGLGLDSIDALELGMAIQEKFGVGIDADDENTREYFRSVSNLAAFVMANRASSDTGDRI